MKKAKPSHAIEDTDFYLGLAILCAALDAPTLSLICFGIFIFIWIVGSSINED